MTHELTGPGSADQTVHRVALERNGFEVNKWMPVVERPNQYNVNENDEKYQEQSGDGPNPQGGSSSIIEPLFAGVPQGRPAKTGKTVEAN